jgi:hypothetical protein
MIPEDNIKFCGMSRYYFRTKFNYVGIYFRQVSLIAWWRNPKVIEGRRQAYSFRE